MRSKLLMVMLAAATPACALQNNPKGPDDSQPAAQAASPSELRPKVEALLSGYEAMPSDEDWKRLGPGVLGVLEQIYADPKMLPTRRTRAVASMAQIDHPDAAAKLLAIIEDPKADEQYRSTALLAYAHKTGVAAVPKLTPYLESPEARIRESAARAIGRAGGTDARTALEARLENEEEPAVREAIQQSLTKTQP